jgi:hypothetical protein
MPLIDTSGELQLYNYDIILFPGVANILSDQLSRQKYSQTSKPNHIILTII